MNIPELNSKPHVRVANQTLEVNGARRGLYGGAIHYWRLDPKDWSGILDSVVAMGYRMVSIYIPWEVHELERGKFDFGQVNPAHDIDRFLTLCEEKDLDIVVRPGPQINSELTWFGYPERILANERIQARNAKGTRVVLTQVPRPIPALSYAADEFFDETALWYDAITPILVKHAVPRGRLVACQVDNEMAYFFCINNYSSDYSDASIAKYRTFLGKKYGSIAGINAAHRTNCTTVDEIEPPRKFLAHRKEDLPAYLDWAEYREYYLVDSIRRLAAMLRERGLDEVALFHNYPHPLGPGGASSNFTTPFNLMALEEVVDYVGFDVYSRKELFSHVKTVTSYVAGSSRYPYIPEFIGGVWAWYLNPGNLDDEEFVTKAALMHGIKGFSRYMLVERDRWLDSPIRRDGTVRPDKAAVFGGANRMLDRLDWQDMHLEAPVALLANRDYDRLEAASVLVSFPGDFLETPSTFSEYANVLTVSEESLGLDQPVQMDKREWFARWYQELDSTQVGFVLSDTQADVTRLRNHRAVVLTTFEFLAREVQENLVEYVRGGGALVLGPKVPSLGTDMQPCSVLADALGGATAGTYQVGSGTVRVVGSLDGVRATVDEVAGLLPRPQASVDNPQVSLTVHTSSGDHNLKAVFVANPTADSHSVTIRVNGTIVDCLDAWAGHPVDTQGDELHLHLPAYTVNAYRMQLA